MLRYVDVKVATSMNYAKGLALPKDLTYAPNYSH